MAVEHVAERVDAHTGEQAVLVHFSIATERHQAEAPRIVIGGDGAVFHAENHMIVRPIGQRACIAEGKAARHAQMDDQHGAVIEIGEDIFAAPLQPLEAPPRHARREVFRQRNSERLTARFGVGHALAEKTLLQSAPDRFHFGQFWHGA